MPAIFGSGLERDLLILGEVLERGGHEINVSVPHFREQWGERFDLNIFLEHLGNVPFLERYLEQAQANALIPNAEWFYEEWIPHLGSLDLILCKTKDSAALFSSLTTKPVVYTSFTSQDRYIRGVRKRSSLFHSAGRSGLKGTEQIVALWEEEHDWLPKLDLHFSQVLVAESLDLYTVAKVTKVVGPLPDATFRLAQNRSQIHLCPSIYEGFGHYINEAKSVGAVVVTTDGPPMNELIRSDFGFLIPTEERVAVRVAMGSIVSVEALRSVIREGVLPLLEDRARLLRMGRRARADFLENDSLFRERLLALVGSL